MKKIKNVFLLVPMVCMIFLASCSRHDEITEEVEPTAQLGPTDKYEVRCCADYQVSATTKKCLVAYEFDSNPPFGNYPNGAYPVYLYSGDCDCVHGANGLQFFANGAVLVQKTGWVVTENGNDPCGVSPSVTASELWPGTQFQGAWATSTNGGNGGGYPGWPGDKDNPTSDGTWQQWCDDIVEANNNNPTGGPTIGLMHYPPSWGLGIYMLTQSNKVKITLATTAQANQLRRIGIFSDLDGSPAEAYVTADGSREYEIDMAGISEGVYFLKMDFDPGFFLIDLITQKTPAR